MNHAWVHEAACRDMDLAVFYPKAREGGRRETDWSKPRAICGRCVVRQACLADALKEEQRAGDIHGMRGGLTDKERARLVKR